MAVREILKYPHPVLKTKAEEVERVDDELISLVSDMIETMYKAGGIGLAANQVGVCKRVIVLDVPDDEERENYERGRNLLVLLNPEIVESDGSIRYEEGCLSVPGVTADVVRAMRVRVRGLDRKGDPLEIEAEGLLAIALQHEIDHLDGILFIDRLSRLKRDMLKRKYRKSMEAGKSATTVA